MSSLPMKYIVFDEDFLEVPIIFPGHIPHLKFLPVFGENPSIISAGFVSHNEDGFACWGDSESLHVASRGKVDADLMNEFFSPGMGFFANFRLTA